MNKSPTSKRTQIKKAIDATVKGLQGFVEVFRAGTHTDSKGRSVTFSKADVEQMVDNHKLGAAPAVIGHPIKDTAPAYAQVAEYKLEEDGRLFAKFDKINPAFEKGVESGAYYNRSVSVVKDKVHGWRVRHVGWLGAMPPAIDGLEPLAYSGAADEETCFEFAAPGYSLVWGLESCAKLLRRLRDRMIEKEGLEAADTTLPQWEIDSVNESASTARAQFNDDKPASLFNQPTEDETMITQEQHDTAVAQARAEGEAAGKQGMVPESQFSAAQAELLTIKKAEQKTRITAQIADWKAKGIILPRDEAGLCEYMASLEDEGKEFSFAKAEGGEEKKTALAFFSEFMASRGPVVKIGGAKDGDQGEALDVNDSAAVGQAASDFMVAEEGKGRKVGAAAAVQHVIAVAKGEK
jgi:hypothetical protein